ncbi:MAG: 16S rRNA (adenine(1518)-N(6)/adenine(1519)-N(6))-dimethyltransferase RsmA [Armatimonadota bacterium]|nr:16S rRNA (adenine(1518)-N(6)/adenine(1519)-N(6))-dimethyltransferase RsmA [Armatimonadota bacterium]MDR7451196.1 16S rRNA (adenine(1518)-N(6)/adenine(1519)-N(6))-dimethyltransferase RsmA [Armatimonadota bacterium]MDR7467199.1 16S rRNA (adenine(1518)-N(6)/adenine(1519)-N(6))-dimethyltransferase RsmA [Armatimonadota bacterium]MDR7494873.1 16S rRNA (adenine(1518)-N(6)/adenine(1519)-N(6))-dimethyltransferase RsmA [Armatimonadota bacterium]MDR7500077.1 16S rRNA (adenine(1518)-N(6)/adenine(1519)-N
MRDPGGRDGDLLSAAATARRLRAYGLRPRRRLGQHFLISPAALAAILEAAALSGSDGVLEIGAGIGTLTAALATRAKAVIAVEFDAALMPPLQDAVAAFPNVTLVQGDILALDLAALVAGLPVPRKSVSNLPYNIAAPVILALLERPLGFTRLVVTVQREVADRLVARPGERAYGALSVAVQYRARASIAGRISPGAFYPPPAVDSAIVVLETLPAPAVAVVDEPLFFRVVRSGFAQRRKTLRNAVAAALGVAPAAVESVASAAGIDPRRRAETLTLEEFALLTDLLAGALAAEVKAPPPGKDTR